MKKILGMGMITILFVAATLILGACGFNFRGCFNVGRSQFYAEELHGRQGGRPSNTAISLERAIEIAYEDLARRSINAAYRSNSGMAWERGQWVWELLFRAQNERKPFIEFYINVNNGNIVKFEWDD